MKKILVTVAGTLLCLAGIVLAPLPGPGMLVLAAGLGLLATEYAWARRALRWAQASAQAGAARTASSRLLTLSALLFGLGLLVVGAGEIVGFDMPLLSVWTAPLLIAGGAFLLVVTVRERRRHLRRQVSSV